MRSGEHLLNLINDVLDISKVESGRIDLLPRDIHLRDFIENIRAIFEPRCAEKKIRWTIECGEKLLDGLYADEQKLRQVLINLLGNAVKFTEKGGVHFRVFALSEKIVFEVKDTGPGIAKEDQEKIFEPFQQVGSLDRRAEGTGLGLAIVKRLVTLMGGEIEMESMPGAGTLFRVSIPAQPARSEVQSVADILNDDRPIGYEGEIKKILIVDDRKENREVLLDLLHPLGFDVLLCENGYEALNKVNTWRPHLIFMDLRMPNMNGLETTRLLRKSPAVPHVKIVAISASAFDIDQTDCTVAGCDDFIPKPQGVWLDVS